MDTGGQWKREKLAKCHVRRGDMVVSTFCNVKLMLTKGIP